MPLVTTRNYISSRAILAGETRPLGQHTLALLERSSKPVNDTRSCPCAQLPCQRRAMTLQCTVAMTDKSLLYSINGVHTDCCSTQKFWLHLAPPGHDRVGFVERVKHSSASGVCLGRAGTLQSLCLNMVVTGMLMGHAWRVRQHGRVEEDIQAYV